MRYRQTFATLCAAVFAMAGSLMGQVDGGAFTHCADLRPCVKNRRYEDFRKHVVELTPFPFALEESPLGIALPFQFPVAPTATIGTGRIHP